MANKEEVLNKILAALQQKTANRSRACSVCNQNSWTLGDRFVRLAADQQVIGGALMVGGPTYPCAVLICTNCGNTLLLNLLILGFQNLDELTITEEAGHGVP